MEWTLHCTVERQASRMHEMMKRLDVDALALVRQKNGEVYAEARSRCLLCHESVRCLRWLDGKSGGGRTSALSSTASTPADALTLLLLDV